MFLYDNEELPILPTFIFTQHCIRLYLLIAQSCNADLKRGASCEGGGWTGVANSS